jgi:hypothetical protein
MHSKLKDVFLTYFCFTIKRSQSNKQYLNALISIAAIAAIAYYLYLALNFSANVMYFYTPDSWYYWAVSQSFGTASPNTSNIIRQYQYITDTNISFPPLWPLVIYVIDKLGSFGYYSNLVASGTFFIFSIFLIEILFIRFTKRHYAGVFVGLLMLAYRPFVLDLMGGMSASLNLFLMSFALLVFHSRSSYKPVFFGLLCGLLYLNRFDNVLVVFSLFLFATCFFEEQRQRFFQRSLGFLVTFALVVSPYIVANIIRFGIPFVSDNSIVFKSISNSYSTSYFIDHPLTFHDSPVDWISKFIANFLGLLDIFLASGFLYVIAAILYISFLRSFYVSFISRITLAALLIPSLLMMFVVAGTGYNDMRYFIPVYFVGTLILCNSFINLKWFPRALVIILMCIQVKYYLFTDHLFFYETRNPPSLPAEIVNEGQALAECLKVHGAKSVMPVYNSPSEGQIISYFGSSLGYKVFLTPNNLASLTEDQFIAFSKRFNIDAIYERSTIYGISHIEYPVLCASDSRVRFRKGL